MEVYPEKPTIWNTKNIIKYLYVKRIPIGDKFLICLLCGDAEASTKSKFSYLDELRKNERMTRSQLTEKAVADLVSRISLKLDGEVETEGPIFGKGFTNEGIMTMCEVLVIASDLKSKEYIVSYVDTMEKWNVPIFG